MKCKHKKYKATRKPSTGCIECWKFYLEQHPTEKLNNECCLSMEIYKTHMNPKFNEIIIDKYQNLWYINMITYSGNDLSININFCPFCGVKLI